MQKRIGGEGREGAFFSLRLLPPSAKGKEGGGIEEGAAAAPTLTKGGP